jgi:hypothetical protein
MTEPVISLATAEAHLAKWLEADLALADGQSYSIAGRGVTRAETTDKIKYWSEIVSRLRSNGGRGGVRMRVGVTG